MKKYLPRAFHLRKLVALASVVLLCCVAASAQQSQTREAAYLISAKAGKVNAFSGKASVQRRGSAALRPLMSKDDLDSGDVLKTEVGARVELLLNPGSYLRVAENSEVELTDASLDNLQFKVTRGSAIIEATGTDGTRLLAEVRTPQTKILIDRNGLYRINVMPAATTTEVLVYKGRALVGSNTLTAVKGGSKIIVGGTGGADTVAKFDKKSQDDFDFWSKQRAGALAAANRSLTGRTVTNALASFRNNGAFGYGYAPYFGLWVFDPALSGYTFLPFYSRWSSPYGSGYQNSFGIPWYYYRPSPPGSQPLPNPGNNGGNGGVIVNPPVAGVPIVPPNKRNPDNPDDPDNPEPIHNRPIRPMPVGEHAERFDRAFEGARGRGRGDVEMNDAPMRGTSGNNGGMSVDSTPAPSAPVHQERIERTESPRSSEPINGRGRHEQP